MKTSLAKILTRKKALAGLLQQAAALPLGIWCIEDESGQKIFGKMPSAVANEHPVWIENEIAGYVKSEISSSASFIAALIENWLRQEAEKKQLGTETLHLYREINLIFSFSEKLATALDAGAIARLILQEAGQIIQFDAAGVFLRQENGRKTQLLAVSNGERLAEISPDFLQNAANSGKSDIIAAPVSGERMLLRASMRLGQQVLGGIALLGASFSAADLHLMTTLASQAAAAIQNAQQHEINVALALKEQREKLTLELALKDPFFKGIMAVVEAGHTDPAFSVEMLADTLHLSVSQLQRKISAVTELTPLQIIRSVRLAHAKELLRTTHLNVSEVAFRVGFNDPSYFTRLFVRELHCTPSEWREKALQTIRLMSEGF